MYVLIAYDVSTTSPEGQKRLRRVAKICLDYGQRVQNSVFECKMAPAHYIEFKNRLIKVIDPQLDSVRFYNLGNNWQHRVEHIGKSTSYDINELLMVD